MGNNEPLPPPPPPGQPPQGPQGPQHQPPPQYPPTQQMPPTSGYPQQGYPQQGYAPAGYGPQGPPPTPPKKKTGLIIGGVVAAAALVGGVVLLAGGDDDKSPTAATLASTVATTAATTAAPTVATTAAPSDTLVITLPPSTAPPMTTLPVDTTIESSDAGFMEVTDDTFTFTVMMPDVFEFDTTPTVIGDFEAANVTGAESIDGYYSDDDTFGFSVLAFGATDLTNAELLAAFSPADGVCGAPTTEIGFPTALGPADMLRFDDCGVASESAKVIMALPLPGLDSVILVYGQGPEPSDDSILIITLYVLESITAA